jgi:antitoxin component of MazEF toxin-antitoxin module
MTKFLTKHGNSFALVIDRPILDLLNIPPDSPLELTTDGQKLTIQLAKLKASRTKNNKRQR